MCTAPTQCWAHGAAPMLAREGLSRHPYLNPSHMPSVTHAHVARTQCLYTACTVWALPCAACAPPSRCLCAACALPMLCLCAAMRTSMRCRARLCALPLYSTVDNMHVLEPMPHVPTASVYSAYARQCTHCLILWPISILHLPAKASRVQD